MVGREAAKNRSLYVVNEHSEPLSNSADTVLANESEFPILLGTNYLFASVWYTQPF